MKESPEDLGMRVEYVRHAFKQLSDHCKFRASRVGSCFHPYSLFGAKCSLGRCPLVMDEIVPLESGK